MLNTLGYCLFVKHWSCKTQGTGDRYDTAANYYIIDSSYKKEQVLLQPWKNKSKSAQIWLSENLTHKQIVKEVAEQKV